MKKFILNLQFIFKPHFWLMNNRYDKSLDELINLLLDRYDFTEIDYSTANLGDFVIWISNYPYSSMMIYDENVHKLRPSRLTILRAKKKLDNCRKKTNIKYNQIISQLK